MPEPQVLCHKQAVTGVREIAEVMEDVRNWKMFGARMRKPVDGLAANSRQHESTQLFAKPFICWAVLERETKLVDEIFHASNRR
jgi:hypothetical protein